MKYLSRRYFKFVFVYVGIIFALSIVHWEGPGTFLKLSFAEAANPAVGIPIDNPGIKRAIEVQNKHVEKLMSIPGVVGVGTGIGANGQARIRVFTMKAGIPNIPQKLEEIPVEMKVTGMFVAYSDPLDRWDRWPRPVPIGVSTGHPDITAGTIGARVIDSYGNVYALSNNHVYANINNARIGDYEIQPGTYDGGVDPNQPPDYNHVDVIGQLCDFESIDFSLFGSNTIDAAIVCTTPGLVGNSTPKDSQGNELGYGTPNSVIWGDSDSNGEFDNVNNLLGLHVQKFGRTTGLTHGQVSEVNVTVNVCYDNCDNIFYAYLARFVDQLSITPGNFSAGGDSGSLIVTDDANNNPVGLLFAGSSTNTLANRIDLVLNRFDVRVDGGSSSGNITPSADFNYTADDLAVQFTDQSSDSDGSIASWHWEFGDGETSEIQSPQHVYAASGTYDVTLTVTDDDSGTDSISQNVTVSSVSSTTIMLDATGKQNKKWLIINLDWSGATSANVVIFRNGEFMITTSNDGAYTDKISNDGGGPYTYQVCEEGPPNCSAVTPVAF
jgi:PKD repeat protein